MKSNQTVTGTTKFVVIALAVWLALVWFLGARGAFAGPPGAPPLPILLGVLVPIAGFLIAFRFSRAFREFVLAYDLRLGAGMQAWRFAGLGFLALYAQGVLPASFALPAGLGDMAIGITAPWIMLALIHRPSFAASRLFVVWNLLGMLDLIAAVSSGGLNALLARGIPGEITTGPMTQLPLILIPAYFVPIFFMLHLSALFQVRRLRALNDRDSAAAASSTALPAAAH
jgi:hypothetical protein